MSRDAILTKLPRMSASCLARNGLSKMPAVDMSHDPYDVQAPKAEKPSMRQKTKGMNKWEAEFLEYLREIRAGYEIKREGIGIRLGNGCVYWPDFTVGTARTEIWEVKGRRLSTGISKIKIAATMWPTWDFYLVTKKRKADGGGWRVEEVMP